MTATAKTTVLFGIAFLLLAGGFYVATGMEQPTALIPGAWGIIYLICGLASRSPRSTKIAMHVAAVFALLGLTVVQMIIKKWQVPLTLPLIEQMIHVGLNLILLLIYIRAFITARRAA